MATTYSIVSDPEDRIVLDGNQVLLKNKLALGTSYQAIVERNSDGTIKRYNLDIQATPRVREIKSTYGGRLAIVPQGYHDYVAVDSKDINMHPQMGEFTHVAVKSGRWSDPTMWDAGTVPSTGSNVNVGSFTCTYDVESDALIKDIHVGGQGTFRVDPSVTTRLWVDTFMCHGTSIEGDLNAPILDSGIVNADGRRKPRHERIYWASQAPLTTARLGGLYMGPTRILGEKKKHTMTVTTAVSAGATSITIPDLASANWRVGDEIVVISTSWAGTVSTDTTYKGPTTFYGVVSTSNDKAQQNQTQGFVRSRDEVRIITNISGNVVSFSSPLTWNHEPATRTLKDGKVVSTPVYIDNLSRSIVHRTAGGVPADLVIWADADVGVLQKRAHLMFMFCDDVDIRWFETRDMARTDTNPSLTPVGQASTWMTTSSSSGVTVFDPLNVRGRYAVHFHGTGAYFGRNQVKAVGVVCRGQTGPDMTAIPMPGWALVGHNSRHAFEDCITYNTRGAGIVSEAGNEIGQWIGCHSIWNRGDGFLLNWGLRGEHTQNHNGHSGVGFESQARQVLQQYCVVSSSNQGWAFLQQNVGQSNISGRNRVPDKNSIRVYHPTVLGYGYVNGTGPESEGTYGIEQTQIIDFDFNTAFATRVGFFVSHRQFTDRLDTTPMISKQFHAVSCVNAYHLENYSFHYYFYDCMWIGTGTGTGTGASLGPVSWYQSFINNHLENFNVGFLSNGTGFNYGGVFIDNQFVGVSTPGTNFTTTWDVTAYPIENHALKHVMGPWTNSGNNITLRAFKNLDSATELPWPYPAAPRGAGGVEPSPGTPKPYFVLDTTNSTTNVNATGGMSLRGTIVDDVGVRYWPDWMSSESFTPTTTGERPSLTLRYAVASDIVERNGVFLDGATWKSRLWFTELDRLKGEYFSFYVDVTITGVATDVLNANIVDPNSTKPSVPLKAELIESINRGFLPRQKPSVTSAASVSVPESQPLAHTLKANQGQGRWAISGADMDHFEIVGDSGVYVLRFVNNETRDYETPLDSNSDNTYNLSVTFINQFGISSDAQPLTVTITDLFDNIMTTFTDNFTSGDRAANDPLEKSIYWERRGGTASAGQLRPAYANGPLVLCSLAGATRTAYASPNTGSQKHAAQAVSLHSYNQSVIAVCVTDSNNWIGVGSLNGRLELVKCLNGTSTVVKLWTYAHNNAKVIRLEWDGATSTAVIKIDGTILDTVVVTSPPPLTTRCGVVMNATGTAGQVSLDEYGAYAL